MWTDARRFWNELVTTRQTGQIQPAMRHRRRFLLARWVLASCQLPRSEVVAKVLPVTSTFGPMYGRVLLGIYDAICMELKELPELPPP
jgi:hypothetical protein